MLRILSLVLVLLTGGALSAQNLIYLYNGVAAGDNLGSSVADAGDVDGDGSNDFIIGAPLADGVGTNVGAAYLYTSSNGTLIRQFNGTAANQRMGAKVAGGADVNGDGTADQAVALPGATVGTLTNAGQVMVYSGTNGNQIFQIDGPVGFNTFGSSLALGDVNNDGQADIIVGAWNENFGFGAVRVYSGANAQQLLTILGPAAGARWGYDVAYMGDVNGDGFGDIAIGNNSNSLPAVYSGNTGGVLYSLPGPPALGWAISNIGDIDSDGINDIACSAPGVFLGDDIVQTHSGVDGSLIWSISRDPDWIGFGRALTGADDLNYDGIPDLVAGADFTGVNGTRCGSIHAIDGVNGDILYTVYGFDQGMWYGSALASLPDINADGAPELLVAAQNEDNGTGSLRLLSGYLAAGVWADNAHMGTGCSGGTGPTPRLNVNPLPVLGQTITMTVSRVAPSTAGVLVIDISWPLRLNLGGGCSTYMDLTRFAQWVQMPFTTNFVGAWSLPYPLPNDPSLSGFPISMQAIFPGGSTAIGVDLSNTHFSRLGF